MQIYKDNKAVVITVLAIFVILFYWFALRPAQARKQCASKANQQAKYQQWDKTYDICLKEKGIAR